MSKITIDEEVLQQLLKQVTLNNKKRKEGSFELYGNAKARLYYTLNKERYRTTVVADSEEEAQRKLAIFVEDVKKGNFINTNYTFRRICTSMAR